VISTVTIGENRRVCRAWPCGDFTEAGGLDGSTEHTAQAVHHQGCKGSYLDCSFGDDQQGALPGAAYLLEHRTRSGTNRSSLSVSRIVGLLEDAIHPLGVGAK